MDDLDFESAFGVDEMVDKATSPASYVGPSGTYFGPGDGGSGGSLKASLAPDYAGMPGTFSGLVDDWVL